MGDLLHLHDAHEQAQLLLPWHVNGTLESAETVWLEAHLAECAECRADLEAEEALRIQVATMPVDVEPARLPVFDRIAARPKPPATAPWEFLRRRITVGWALAGQAAIAAVAVAAFLATPTSQDGEYRLLGSQPEATRGNVIVLFSPDTAERDLRAALVRNCGRLVDGPTASGAYIVRVPEATRDRVLDRLRQVPQVVLAEPIDVGDDP